MKASGFSRGMLYFIKWKVQLRKFIEGKGHVTASEYIHPDKCRFGLWLCSDEIRKYASDLEIREIRKVHALVHKTARRVYELKISGEDVAARHEFKNMETSSMKLVSLLNTTKIISRN